MKVKQLLILIFVGLLAACSIDVSDNPTPAPTAGNENTAVESPAADGTAPTESSADLPWAELGLEGSIYFNAYIQEQQNLLRLNLETGEQTTIFDPPEDAWLSDIAVSPNGREIVMAYGPPPPEGQVQFGFTDLYTMPIDGSAEPAPLLLRGLPNETYYNISWPLDDYIYYAHFAPQTDDLGSIIYISQVERLHIPSGEVEILVTAAAWPRLSPDGTMLAYVTDSNEFTISEPDGSNPRVIELPTTRFPAVDAPLFSPDNSTLYFSVAAPEVQPVRSIWDRLMGVQVVEAHNVPSDWWRIAVDGSGEPQQLTNLFEIGMYGDFGPNGQYIAFITSAGGVNVMNPDGTGVFSLKKIATSGTLDWVR